jgi:hypothetical protein
VEQLPASIVGQRWLHSHEEDTANEMVFRPATYSFGPSRGRTGFELRPDGSALAIGIARADGPQEVEAKWSLEGGNEIRIQVPHTQETRSLDVLSVAPDRLVVRKG